MNDHGFDTPLRLTKDGAVEIARRVHSAVEDRAIRAEDDNCSDDESDNGSDNNFSSQEESMENDDQTSAGHTVNLDCNKINLISRVKPCDQYLIPVHVNHVDYLRGYDWASGATSVRTLGCYDFCLPYLPEHGEDHLDSRVQRLTSGAG
ncbi:hypothetical protein E4U19_001762 [Claviceps sp. Clav32 group G5]|nr:hypothetical protein E4U19_001762 [Claviceps sp. Clav32 group G5]KAG6045838.1 hypothetical protein E4U39_001914 [Claviceps sp. Clav50 group G5]